MRAIVPALALHVTRPSTARRGGDSEVWPLEHVVRLCTQQASQCLAGVPIRRLLAPGAASERRTDWLWRSWLAWSSLSLFRWGCCGGPGEAARTPRLAAILRPIATQSRLGRPTAATTPAAPSEGNPVSSSSGSAGLTSSRCCGYTRGLRSRPQFVRRWVPELGATTGVAGRARAPEACRPHRTRTSCGVQSSPRCWALRRSTRLARSREGDQAEPVSAWKRCRVAGIQEQQLRHSGTSRSVPNRSLPNRPLTGSVPVRRRPARHPGKRPGSGGWDLRVRPRSVLATQIADRRIHWRSAARSRPDPHSWQHVPRCQVSPPSRLSLSRGITLRSIDDPPPSDQDPHRLPALALHVMRPSTAAGSADTARRRRHEFRRCFRGQLGLWVSWKGNAALEAAVRAGWGTDTVAANAGALLGAHWGASARRVPAGLAGPGRSPLGPGRRSG